MVKLILEQVGPVADDERPRASATPLEASANALGRSEPRKWPLIQVGVVHWPPHAPACVEIHSSSSIEPPSLALVGLARIWILLTSLTPPAVHTATVLNTDADDTGPAMLRSAARSTTVFWSPPWRDSDGDLAAHIVGMKRLDYSGERLCLENLDFGHSVAFDAM